ncbi:MAG: 3-oxoadipate enol-lactonase [Azospira oryzae]|nr:MAG: 3-oxoadipate enol-lactonase [Azospira oryzae]PZP78679.1 MAG: 3-oxoadipate enol-lactonase [Azospira oryzae]
MRVKANGIEINYEVEGQGPWLVFSHSLACHLGMWYEQAVAFRDRYRILRYDTRGHGKTSAPAGPYTLELLADDLLGLLDALGIDRMHFVGISLGGMIGQVFALRHPERLASLTLCDTTSYYPPEAWPMWEERIRVVREKGMEAMVEPTLARWFTDAFRARRHDVMKRIGAMIRATPVEGYIGCCHAIPKIDTRARLKEIRCPTLVIVGEEDAGTPVAMARAIHEAIPGSRLAVISQASHLCNLEQTEAFNRILGDFVDAAA